MLLKLHDCSLWCKPLLKSNVKNPIQHDTPIISSRSVYNNNNDNDNDKAIFVT